MESPELYVKQETVGTAFNSEYQPDEPGDRICASVARWANMDDTAEKRIYARQTCRTWYSGRFGETSSPSIRRSKFVMEWDGTSGFRLVF